jgi:hypothetical protein
MLQPTEKTNSLISIFNTQLVGESKKKIEKIAEVAHHSFAWRGAAPVHMLYNNSFRRGALAPFSSS